MVLLNKNPGEKSECVLRFPGHPSRFDRAKDGEGGTEPRSTYPGGVGVGAGNAQRLL